MERNRDLQNKMLKMKESTNRRVVWVAVVAGGLAWAIGFIAGAILTLPDREETKAALAAAEAKAERRIEEERKNAQATIASIKAEAENELNTEREAEEIFMAELARKVQENAENVKAEIARLKDERDSAIAERDSAIAELNQVKQQYDEALSRWNETRLSLDPEEKGNYDFQEVSINIKPRFILPDNLGMGNWVYRAYNVYDNDSGRYFAAIELEIEIIPNLMTLPPIGLNLEVLRGGNKIVGRGMLVPIEFKIGEKSRYKGVVIVESFSDIEIIRILKI